MYTLMSFVIPFVLVHHGFNSVVLKIISAIKSGLKYRCDTTAVRSISEQIQLVSYLRSNAFGGVVGKRLI